MCFSRFDYHVFYVLYQFVTCLLTLPRIHIHCKMGIKIALLEIFNG
jgi:hypothetical protein